MYTFKGYTEDGKLQVIKRMMNRELHTGAFIKFMQKVCKEKDGLKSKESIPQKRWKNRKTIKGATHSLLFSTLK